METKFAGDYLNVKIIFQSNCQYYYFSCHLFVHDYIWSGAFLFIRTIRTIWPIKWDPKKALLRKRKRGREKARGEREKVRE